MPHDTQGLRPKRNWTHIYNQDNPRAYFQTLEPLGYRQPDVVADFLLKKGEKFQKYFGRESLRLVDFACGYGALGAVLRHCLTMQDLYSYFSEDEGIEPGESDRAFFARHRREPPLPHIVGIDIADKAIAYAKAAGLVDEAYALDLSEDAPPPALVERFETADLVIETGAVYPHVPDCYGALLEASDRRPWMLFGPRGDSVTRLVWDLLQRHGYAIEEFSRHNRRYRRYADAEEEADMEANMDALGRDTRKRSRGGWFLNPLMLARPKEETGALPIEDLYY